MSNNTLAVPGDIVLLDCNLYAMILPNYELLVLANHSVDYAPVIISDSFTFRKLDVEAIMALPDTMKLAFRVARAVAKLDAAAFIKENYSDELSH